MNKPGIFEEAGANLDWQGQIMYRLSWVWSSLRQISDFKKFDQHEMMCAIYTIARLKIQSTMRNVLFFSRFAPKRFLSTLREKNAPADYGSTMGNQR